MPTDDQRRAEFIGIERQAGAVHMRVMITWEGLHTSSSRWVAGTELPNQAPVAGVEATVGALLDDPRCFGTWAICRQRQPVGWMHPDRVCQQCAERHLGVVH